MTKEVVKVDHQQIVDKLQNMLRDSGWHNLLKGFMVSEDFKSILETLETFVNDNKRFTPPLKQVFRAFQECPLSNLKVIVIGQDPYPQLGVADGIAFSCGNTNKRETPLRHIHKAIVETVYDNQKDVKELSTDLSCWSHQGVLLLNTALTTEINKSAKHLEVWKSFTAYLIDMLNAQNHQYVWVFLGEKAQQYSDLVDDKHFKIFASHPATAAHQSEQSWDCNNLFNKVNEFLVQQQKEVITW